MASKSAAKFKPVESKPKKMTREQMREELEKLVDNAKQSITYSIGIQIDQCERFDNLLAIHDSFARFHGDGYKLELDEAFRIAEWMSNLLKQVKDAVCDLTFDSIIEDGSNPIDKLIPETGTSDWDSVLVAAILFSAIRPWGEQLDSLRQQVMMRAHELGYIEEEKDGE